jgi:agmatinase
LALNDIYEAFSQLLGADARTIAIGGDHAITYPIIRAYARFYQPLTILQFDAHPDLYDTYDGNRLSHACPFARIMEEALATRLVQVGIRSTTPHQQRQAERFGAEVVAMRSWTGRFEQKLEGPLYISLDLDALDPAFAPGVSHHEPGGFSTRDILGIIQQLRVPIVGADIVELNPKRDQQDMTATVAAKCFKELAAKMAQFPYTKRGPSDQNQTDGF